MTGTEPLPEYDNPPVVEVVCGLAFEPIPKFTVPYLGLLWAELGSEFSSCQEVAPLPAVTERPDGLDVKLSVDTPMLPRVWFVNRSGDQIVQVQRDRFLCNWRKTEAAHRYPRYGWISGQFTERLALFERFIEKRFAAQVEPRQYELIYTNHIFAGAAWRTLSDIGAVLPDVSWRAESPRFLPAPGAIIVSASFDFPANAGRLHVGIQNARRRTDGEPVLVLELTARGFSPDRASWFELAHEWIVRSFADLTGEAVQNQIWRRRQ